MTKSILILGATGRIGRHAANAFFDAGWSVRRFDRSSGQSLENAADGVDIILNAWNPPYPDWAKTVPRLTEAVIAAAKATGAAVMIPGNVYVYGPSMPAEITPETPHRATNLLGRIRRDMEGAYKASGVKTVILRAGDFIDTEASGNWFDRVIFAQIAKGKMAYPGEMDRPHAWAYLPDMASAFVKLAERIEDLPAFTDVPFPGFTMTGQRLSDLAQSALETPVAARQMSWLPIKVARPFWPTAKGLLEMRYLWSAPHSLDGSALSELIGDVPQSDPVAAIRRALEAHVHPNQAVV